MEEIAERISKILEYYHLNAATFADKIGVQRSGLSHILTGRNKPSLDFIIKITDAFDAVDLNWLVHGKGSFPKSITIEKVKMSEPIAVKVASTPIAENVEKLTPTQPNLTTTEIQKIMIFYNDGTFSEYIPR